MRVIGSDLSATLKYLQEAQTTIAHAPVAEGHTTEAFNSIAKAIGEVQAGIRADAIEKLVDTTWVADPKKDVRTSWFNLKADGKVEIGWGKKNGKAEAGVGGKWYVLDEGRIIVEFAHWSLKLAFNEGFTEGTDVDGIVHRRLK